MSVPDAISEFLTRVTSHVERAMADNPDARRLVVVEDEQGIVAVDATSSPLADHELLRQHVERGANGAAYINVVLDRDEAFARILLRKPPNSGVRRARVVRTDTGIDLGPWEYVIAG